MEESVTPLDTLGKRVAKALDEYTTERQQAVERARRGYLAAAIACFRGTPTSLTRSEARGTWLRVR